MDYKEIEIWKNFCEGANKQIEDLTAKKEQKVLEKKIYEGKVAEAIQSKDTNKQNINQNKVDKINKELIDLINEAKQLNEQRDIVKSQLDQRIEQLKSDPEINKQINEGLVTRFERKQKQLKIKEKKVANLKKVLVENPEFKDNFSELIRANQEFKIVNNQKNGLEKKCNSIETELDKLKSETNPILVAQNKENIIRLSQQLAASKSQLDKITNNSLVIATKNLKTAKEKVNKYLKDSKGIELPSFDEINEISSKSAVGKFENGRYVADVYGSIRNHALKIDEEVKINNVAISNLKNEKNFIKNSKEDSKEEVNNLENPFEDTMEIPKLPQVVKKINIFKRFWNAFKKFFKESDIEEEIKNDSKYVEEDIKDEALKIEQESLDTVAENVGKYMTNEKESTPSFRSKFIRDLAVEREAEVRKEAKQQMKSNKKDVEKEER